MLPPIVDGLAVLPELTDNAVLVSNLLPNPVRGRDKIVKIMCALEEEFVVVTDLERINTAGHRMIESRALMPAGNRVQVTVLGTRNDDGWIDEVVLSVSDSTAIPALAKVVADASK